MKSGLIMSLTSKAFRCPASSSKSLLKQCSSTSTAVVLAFLAEKIEVKSAKDIPYKYIDLTFCCRTHGRYTVRIELKDAPRSFSREDRNDVYHIAPDAAHEYVTGFMDKGLKQ